MYPEQTHVITFSASFASQLSQSLQETTEPPPNPDFIKIQSQEEIGGMSEATKFYSDG